MDLGLETAAGQFGETAPEAFGMPVLDAAEELRKQGQEEAFGDNVLAAAAELREDAESAGVDNIGRADTKADAGDGLSFGENDIFETGTAGGKIRYLSTEHQLKEPALDASSIDVEAPFSSFRAVGNWLKDAADLRNYYRAAERLGEDVATYKWAYDEGDLGSFDGKEFAKEAFKAAGRGVASGSLKMTGNLFSMFGANLENGAAFTTAATAGAGAMIPKAGALFKKVGAALSGYADTTGDIELWRPSPALYEEGPSWTKLANVIGQGSSQVMAMGGMSKLIGAGATYALFAGAGAGEVFDESLKKDGDVSKANTAAMLNAGATFTIDKLFNPLPKQVERNAKRSAKLIAKEMAGAPLREAGSEVLQQMLAENLVRKAGIDDTQDLFEGLIESAIGAMAGSSVLIGVDGSMYAARKVYEDARRRIMLKGVSREELELYSEGMLSFMEKKPEAFDKIFAYNLEENLREIERSAKESGTRSELKEVRRDVKAFRKARDLVYERAKEAFNDEHKAKVAAGMFEANAISLYRVNGEFSPQKLIEDGRLPNFKQRSFAEFLQEHNAKEAVSFQFAGIKAKKADLASLTPALQMEKLGTSPDLIWSRTGWYRGADGKMRREISDKNAKIKLWDTDKLEELGATRLRRSLAELESVRAHLAASLEKSLDGSFGDYYQEFLKYLDENKPKEPWDKQSADPLNSTHYAFEIIDDITYQRRMLEDMGIENLLKKYKEGGHDFNDEETQTIWGALEKKRHHEFLKYYWDDKKGENSAFKELRINKEAELAKNLEFMEKLYEIEAEQAGQRRERSEEIAKQKIDAQPYFYLDIDKKSNYRRYALYQEDFTGLIADMDYRSPKYRRAYMPTTKSEKFLAQEKYNFLPEEQRRLLQSYLDNVEKLYQVGRYIDYIKTKEMAHTYWGREGVKRELAAGKPLTKRRLRYQQLFLLENGMKMKLGDILEHPEVFENYPEAENMTVRFTELEGRAPYHFYYDAKGGGYVAEIDADYIHYADFRDTLLRATQFVIQDVEGFDYTLTDSERRNFMDRQYYLAKAAMFNDAKAELEAFLKQYLPKEKASSFIVSREMPVMLAGLASSRASGTGESATERVKFREINYDKLTEAVKNKYQESGNEHQEYLKNLAYWEVQNLRSDYVRKVMSSAKMFGGYSGAGLPWAGVMSQGAVDERAMLTRLSFRSDELWKPYWEDNGELLDDFKANEVYEPEVMEATEEFVGQLGENEGSLRDLVYDLARASYEYGSQTITLFESADAGSIVHEMFHHFWNIMGQAELRNNSHALDFHAVMDTLREDFMLKYRVKEFDGKFYVINDKTGEVMEELNRGFGSVQEASDAGVQELFVKQFMQMLDGKLATQIGDKTATAADFYRQWLFNLTRNLEITPKTAGEGGRAVLQFIKHKIK